MAYPGRSVVGYDHSTVCLETVLGLCYSQISTEDMDHMFLHAPEVIHKIRSDGAVTDVFLDDLGIVKLPDGIHINRDNLVTLRQHAHVMSHRDSKAKFVNYLQMRADRNNPVLQLQIKQREKAAKIVLRETAAREKAEIANREKAAKEVERAAEKERRLRLSPAEKKAEIIERKAEAALRKAAVLLHNADRLRDAIAMMGEDIGAEAQDVVGAGELEAEEMEAEEMEAEL
jgi:hypothetical protein